jgi:uncharacterized membrane protein YebE (DUF533 family)
MPLSTLSPKDRLRLIRFVCSFVWADLEVHERERAFVHKLVKRLRLDPEEAQQVEQWLEVPPKPEEVDPQRIPPEHRKLFLQTVKQVIAADGRVDEGERESLEIFEQLLR